VLSVRQEQVRVVEGFQEGHGTVHWAVFMLVHVECVGRMLIGECCV